MTPSLTSLIKGLSLALILSCSAHAWIEETNGISNDFFHLNFKDVSYGSHVTETQFKESAGNVINYWADLLKDNHSLVGKEKIQVDLSFSDLGKDVLGSASPTSIHNIPFELQGYEDKVNNTFRLANYDYYETHTGTQFNVITGAQAKLLGYGDLAGSAADFTIDFNNTQNFYYGDISGKSLTDDTDPTFLQYDFESVLLHEIAHGMGVISNLKYSADTKTTSLTQVTTVENHEVLDQQGNPLYLITAWDSLIGLDSLSLAQPGSSLTITADTVSVPIYNPDPWKTGSSLSHPVTGGVLDHVISNLTISRSFNEQELYLLEGIGYDIAGIEFTQDIIPEPSTAALSLLALPLLLARRRRRQ